MNGEVRGHRAHKEKPPGHRAVTLLAASNNEVIMNQFAAAHKDEIRVFQDSNCAPCDLQMDEI